MHYSAEVFRAKTGANLTTVPYRGGALATSAVVAGEVQLAFANMSDAMGQLAAGTVRPLAITTGQRSPQMPNIPTLVELKLLDWPIESWNALFAPAGTPQPIIDRLAVVMAQMANDAEVKKRMADFGSIALANSPAEFAKQIRDETAQWDKALKDIGLKP
jgi:tripartite-type tricarboxylate transporter receptor subunit TctC